MAKSILTPAERSFLHNLFDISDEIEDVQEHIKERFGLNSTFDASTNTLHIEGNVLNESLALASAKQLAVKTIGANVLNVVYDTTK